MNKALLYLLSRIETPNDPVSKSSYYLIWKMRKLSQWNDLPIQGQSEFMLSIWLINSILNFSLHYAASKAQLSLKKNQLLLEGAWEMCANVEV